jgi:hypothetical protein
LGRVQWCRSPVVALGNWKPSAYLLRVITIKNNYYLRVDEIDIAATTIASYLPKIPFKR